MIVFEFRKFQAEDSVSIISRSWWKKFFSIFEKKVWENFERIFLIKIFGSQIKKSEIQKIWTKKILCLSLKSSNFPIKPSDSSIQASLPNIKLVIPDWKFEVWGYDLKGVCCCQVIDHQSFSDPNEWRNVFSPNIFEDELNIPRVNSLYRALLEQKTSKIEKTQVWGILLSSVIISECQGAWLESLNFCHYFFHQEVREKKSLKKYTRIFLKNLGREKIL